MSRAWKLLLGGVLGLAVVVTLGLVVEHVRGARILASTRAELKAAGRLPLAAEVFVAPASSNGIRRMVAAVQRLRSPPAPLSLKGIAPGRAVDGFRLKQWAPIVPGRSNTWEHLMTWNQEHSQDLAELHEALEFPECRDSVDWTQGFQALLPSLSSYKGSSMALSAAAMAASRDGDRATAVARLADVCRTEQALVREPLVISQLVRIASASVALPTFWAIGEREDWTEPDLARLQSALPSSNYTAAVIDCLRGETILWEVNLLNPKSAAAAAAGGWIRDQELEMPSGMEAMPEFASEVLQRTAAALQNKVFFPIWYYAWRDQALAFHLRTMDELGRRFQKAAEARSLQSFSTEGLPIQRNMGWFEKLRFSMTRQSLGNIHSILSKALRLETERALVETRIALRRHERRHGRMPERLNELVPEFLTGLPMDGMDGNPLRYRLNPDGTASVWSIGEDFVDNGGDPTPLNANGQTLRWWEAKDAVLPARIQDAELASWEVKEAEQMRKTSQGRGGYMMDPELARRYGLIPKATNSETPAPR